VPTEGSTRSATTDKPGGGFVKDPTATRDGRGRRGRIDVLAIIDDGDERVAVIIELKASDWTAQSPEQVRRKGARHAAQLYSYQGHLTNQMWDEDAQAWAPDGEVQAVQMWLVYERRPIDPDVAAAIEEQLGEDGISVLWFDETAA